MATGVPITISIGSNATFQGQGTHWITNTTSAGTKSINIGGSFGGTGVIDVAIIQSVQLSATVAEILTVTLAGLPPSAAIGNEMSSCVRSSLNNPDFDDLQRTNPIGTTAATVPFGTVVSGTWYYEGCVKVSVTTNAGNGYTVRTRENNPMETAGGGLSIPSTGCDADGCLNTPSSAAAWTLNSTFGLGISCANPSTSVSCSTANPNWGGGVNWAPIANEGSFNVTGGTETPAVFSGLSVATGVEVITKAKFRLSVSAGFAAGIYTNLISFIATPVY